MAVGDPPWVSRTELGARAGTMTPHSGRARSWAEIDLGAVRHNAALLQRLAAPAALCAVVKADAYGHGARPRGPGRPRGRGDWLAVATAEEGVALREAGIDAPVLVLSEPPARGHGRRRGARADPDPVHAPAGVRRRRGPPRRAPAWSPTCM